MHRGTTIIVTLFIVLMIGVFIVEPLSWDAPTLSTETSIGVTEGTASMDEPIGDVSGEQVLMHEISDEALPIFTEASLAQYNGEDPSLPIYLAFEGDVYDVTEGKRFYAPGGAYHFLAGTDGTTLLRIVGGETIREKYSIVGTYEE